MQKKIIALAVAAVASTAAFAQSNVTVYGVADMYAANVGIGSSGTKASVLNSSGLSGSRLGFKGVEDLGGGTKALFTFEFGNLALDSGSTGNSNGMTSTRQSFVGLTGGYGTVIAGRLQTLAYNHNAAFNPTFGTVFDTQNNAIASVNGAASTSAGSNLAIGTGERLDNAIAYVAPAIAGVTLAAAHTSGAVATDVNQFSKTIRASEISASWANGPLALGGVYRKASDVGGLAGDASSILGGSYDFGVAKVLANVGQSKNSTSAGGAGEKYSLTNLAVVAPVSAKGAVIASIATSKADDQDLRATTTAIAYKHSLSARTALYAGVAQTAGNDNTKAAMAGVASTAGGKAVAALAGINHSF